MPSNGAGPDSSRPPTLLHVWSSLDTELLWTYSGPVDSGAIRLLNNHEHGYWVWLLLCGSVRITVDGKSWTATVGQWIVSPHGMALQEFSRDARILSVHFRCQWAMGENLFAGKEGMVFEAKEFPRLERSGSSLQRLVQRHFPKANLQLSMQTADYPIYLRLQQRFEQWMSDFYTTLVQQGRYLSRGGQCDPRLLRAAQCFHESPLDKPFPSERLSRDTGLGRVQLDRLYWKQFGFTPHEYWDNLRERSAARILETTDQPIKEVGYHLGFRQASHFSTWFFRRTKLTPKEYREQARTNRRTARV